MNAREELKNSKAAAARLEHDSLLRDLASAVEPSKALDRRIAARLAIEPAPFTSRMEATRSLIDEESRWWKVVRRKNMPGYQMPNPINGNHLFVATIGRHDSRTAAATAEGMAPLAALCAAVIKLHA